MTNASMPSITSRKPDSPGCSASAADSVRSSGALTPGDGALTTGRPGCSGSCAQAVSSGNATMAGAWPQRVPGFMGGAKSGCGLELDDSTIGHEREVEPAILDHIGAHVRPL